MTDVTFDRTIVPGAGTIRPFDFPPVEASAMESGLGLRTVRLPRLPVVTAALVLDAGEASLDEAHAGLAVLTGNALEGGTEKRSGTELAEALESLGAAFGASTRWDGSVFSVSCLADRMDEAVSLLAEIVRRPTWPAAEVERSRNQRLAAIAQRAKDPGGLASD